MNKPAAVIPAVVGILILALLTAGVIYYRERTAVPPRVNVLTPGNEARLTTVSAGNFSAFVAVQGEEELAVMDFSEPMPLDPPPPGWWHRKFLTRAPMAMAFDRIGGRHGLRLTTDDSASMLMRFVDVDLDTYPLLRWQWFIEDPIDTDRDETTRDGDDHPARLFIRFENQSGQRRAMEIIWGNELRAGEYKYIGGFPHYVANGGRENIGRWWDEEIDLLAIYREIWPQDAEPPRMTDIGLFCDSDETGDDSVAWFASVTAVQEIRLPAESLPARVQ